MKVGMNLLLWADSVVFDRHKGLLDKAKDMGFDGVEVFVSATSMEDCKRFGEYARDIGLGVTALGTLDPSACNPVSPEEQLREKTIPVIREYVDKAIALGADLLAGPFFQGLGYFSGARPTDKEWDMAVDVLRRAFQYAGDKGVSIACEPLNRFEMYLVNTLADGVRFVKDVGLSHVGLLADTMHGNVEELDMAAAVKSALPYIKHVHISEGNRGVPGSGHAIPTAVFDVLKEGGYDDWLTIEAFNMGSPSLVGPLHLWRTFCESDDKLAREGLAFIRSHI